jgi:uncharacterized protein YjiS (DUF1127 family)
MSIVTLHTSRRHHEPATRRPSPAAAAVLKARRFLTMLAVRVHDRAERRATVAALAALSDHELHDIGVDRTEIRSLVHERRHERTRGYVDWRSHDPRY